MLAASPQNKPDFSAIDVPLSKGPKALTNGATGASIVPEKTRDAAGQLKADDAEAVPPSPDQSEVR
jgi:hypothetical protein